MGFSYTHDGCVNVWTDGACLDNGRHNARAGIGVYFADGSKWNVSEPVIGKATNSVAEIMAAARACTNAHQANIRKLQVNTDSEYVIDVMTEYIHNWKNNGWKTVKNESVENIREIQILDRAVQKLDYVRWQYVPAHSNIDGNMMADKFAKEGAKRYNQYN